MKLAPQLSTLVHHCFQPLKKTLLECKSARHASSFFPHLRIPFVPRPEICADIHTVVQIEKRFPQSLQIEIDATWLRSRNGFSTIWRRLGVFVNLISRPEILPGKWAADLGDWVNAEGPTLGFCSNFHRTLLIPDRGFFSSSGYARQRQQGLAAPAFKDRDTTIAWRGNPTGWGELFTAQMNPYDPTLRQRIRLCLLAREAQAARIPGVDLRITGGTHLHPMAATHYKKVGIYGEYQPQSSWTHRQFAIDIDGNANAFSNFFVRLLYGCCVIKVASPRAFRQWYYDGLTPWEHYIPVAADLSDLMDRIDWCRHHVPDCRDVAARGQALALSLTLDKERHKALETIRTRQPYALDSSNTQSFRASGR